MLFRKKIIKTEEYDKEHLRPVILSSICTGEMTVGFQDIYTKEFSGESLVRSSADIEAFKKKYGITEELRKIY